MTTSTSVTTIETTMPHDRDTGKKQRFSVPNEDPNGHIGSFYVPNAEYERMTKELGHKPKTAKVTLEFS